MKKTALLCIAASFVVGCLLTSTRGGDGIVSNDDFKTDFVVVTSKSTGLSATILEKPTVRRLGDRLFLVGKGNGRQQEHWRIGNTVWIAVDNIAEIVEVDSVDQVSSGRRAAAIFANPEGGPVIEREKPVNPKNSSD